jgi:hypothetical protein
MQFLFAAAGCKSFTRNRFAWSDWRVGQVVRLEPIRFRAAQAPN